MTLTLQDVITVLVPAVVALAWVIRLEGRLMGHERVCEQRTIQLDERHEEVRDALQGLDAKIDRLLEER